MPGNPSPAVAHHRARIARRHQTKGAVDDARRDLRAELLAEHVERVVRQLPPLTDSQIERIAAILNTGSRVAT